MQTNDTRPFPFRIEFPPELPISSRAEEIIACIEANQVVILAGETGSGKTTQIPKMCLAAGRGSLGRIACTQPRRVAALSISRRVAEELGVEWGREVGCKVRFSDQTTAQTRIKFLTDGMLLAEVQGDPLLRGYDTIIIDEAHERSLNIDFLLGHLRQLRFRRPDLKIIVTSATIDTQAFSEAFDNAPVIQVSGRTYPVEVIHMPLDQFGSDYVEEEQQEGAEPEDKVSAKAEALHYVDGAVEAVGRVVEKSDSGDILVFMPSERDIRETCDQLEMVRGRGRSGFELIPLFGRLSNAEQQRVFSPTQRRKIIVATNIAETSLTLPGIRFVIDTGLSRLSRYSPQARTRRLPIEPVSRSSADQRKGRAGRVSEGVCIRLYSEEDYEARPRFTQPEIQRANLADVILRLKAFGLGDIERFPFINPPAGKAIRAGYALLEELGAIEQVEVGGRSPDAGGRKPGHADEAGLVVEAGTTAQGVQGEWVLTQIGRELARLPVDPTVGRMILQARREHCLAELLVIASGLSIQDPRERPLDKQAEADAAHRRFTHPDSDFLTLLRIWELFHDQVESLSQGRLRRFCRDHFLSYVRMREWRDIHSQLMDVLRERDDFRLTTVRDLAKSARGARGSAAAAEDARRQGQAAQARQALAGSAKGQARGDHSGRSQDAARGATGRRGRDESEDHQAEAELRYGTRGYTAIHRSILTGLFGNIAYLDEETRQYKATQDRKVALFPGSTLFRRPQWGKGGAANEEKEKNRLARWLMASEIVETTRLYARTNARLDPRWITDLGGHILKVSHSEPFWSAETGRVLVRQRTRLYGLEIAAGSVGYGRVNPVHATEIFIREGLVADTVEFPLDFIAHNRRVRERIEFSLTRMRDSGYLNLDEALFRFYEARLIGKPGEAAAEALRQAKGERDACALASACDFRWVSCVQELVDLVRERRGAEPDFLFIEPEDLRDPESLRHDEEAFPEALPMDNRVIPLNYAYRPGQEDDGVTLDVNVRDAETLTEAAIDWAVPGHTQEKVEHWLRNLPKELRKAFVPLSESVPAVTREVEQLARLRDHGQTLRELLTEHLRAKFGFRFDPKDWDERPMPDHLRVRVRVVDDEGRELCASRELAKVAELLAARQAELSAASAREEPAVWRKARARWEKDGAGEWCFGDVPESVVIGEQAGLPLLAYPALRAGDVGVSLRLMREAEAAASQTRDGLRRLLELALGRDLMWVERDTRRLRELGPQALLIAPLDKLQADLFVTLRAWLTEPSRIQYSDTPSGRVLSAASFAAAVDRSRADSQTALQRVVDALREVVELRQQLLVGTQGPRGLREEVEALVPADFLATTPWERLFDLGRHLRARRLRVERARQNPTKDAERAKLVAPFAAAASRQGRSSRFFWLVEEFRVSVFAQELGTAEPVSAVRLEAEMKALPAVPVPVGAAAQPIKVVSNGPAPKSSTQRSVQAQSQAPSPARAAVPAQASAKSTSSPSAEELAALAAARDAAKAQALLGQPVNPKFAQSHSATLQSAPSPLASQKPAAGSAGKLPAGSAGQLKSFDILHLTGLPTADEQRAREASAKVGSSKPAPAKASAPAQRALVPAPAPVAVQQVKPTPLPAPKPAAPVQQAKLPQSPDTKVPAAPTLNLPGKGATLKDLGALGAFLKRKP